MDNKLTFAQKEFENRIFHFRGTQVMLDSDLAKLYQVDPCAESSYKQEHIAFSGNVSFYVK
jgi:hypothetical protein